MAFWSKVKSLMDKKWKDGKQKIQEKVDRLENTYKGARTQTGKVGNIRVGDRELGESGSCWSGTGTLMLTCPSSTTG